MQVDPNMHIVTKLRCLFAQGLGYPLPTTRADLGVDWQQFGFTAILKPYVVLLHGTTWQTKHWQIAIGSS